MTGERAPLLCWPLNGDMWEHQATYLAEQGVRVISYERRGFGWSDKPWSGYDYESLAADLHALLEKLDVSGVTLVGFTRGGGEVVRYLSRYGSAHVSKAVLVSAVTPSPRLTWNGRKAWRSPVRCEPRLSPPSHDGEPHGLFLTSGDRLNQEVLAFIGGTRDPLTDPELS